MSLSSYKNNKAIEEMVLTKNQNNEPYSQDELAFVNSYIGYGGMWKYESDLAKERGLPVEIFKERYGIAQMITDPVLIMRNGIFLNKQQPAIGMMYTFQRVIHILHVPDVGTGCRIPIIPDLTELFPGVGIKIIKTFVSSNMDRQVNHIVINTGRCNGVVGNISGTIISVRTTL